VRQLTAAHERNADRHADNPDNTRVRYGFVWIQACEFSSALDMSWSKIAETLRRSANLGCTDGENATTAPLVDRPLEITLKSIPSPTAAGHLDHAPGLFFLLNPTRSQKQQGANRCEAGPE
jgi:hypothetical protein